MVLCIMGLALDEQSRLCIVNRDGGAGWSHGQARRREDQMADGVSAKAEWIAVALRSYEGPLLRYAARMTGDLETARDVVQDAFLKLCEADRSKVEGHLAAWLFTVCRNRALDVQKKEGRMDRLRDAGAVEDGAVGPGELAARREAYELVKEVLGSLSEQHNEAFRLKFQDQLTYREISQVMGKSLGTVSNLIATALCAVRDRLCSGAEASQGELS